MSYLWHLATVKITRRVRRAVLAVRQLITIGASLDDNGLPQYNATGRLLCKCPECSKCFTWPDDSVKLTHKQWEDLKEDLEWKLRVLDREGGPFRCVPHGNVRHLAHPSKNFLLTDHARCSEPCTHAYRVDAHSHYP